MPFYKVRASSMEQFEAIIEAKDENGFVVAVDQAFTVKGVGLVAVGHVRSGRVNKHDDVVFAGSDGNAIARSLQVMDLDVEVEKCRGSCWFST